MKLNKTKQIDSRILLLIAIAGFLIYFAYLLWKWGALRALLF